MTEQAPEPAASKTSPAYREKATSEERFIIRMRGVSKIYYRETEAVRVLEGLDLDVPEGSFEALMGPSGSGKSTLLNLLAGLDRPTEGIIDVAGKRIDQMSDGALAKWRAETIGFVFQSYNLLPVLTALENVELPLLLTHLPSSERKKRAQTALRIVGDEPTGDLDRQSADDVLALLERLNREMNKTILMVTHDPAAAERAAIIRRLDKGKLK